MDLKSELLAYLGAAFLTLFYIVALVLFGRRASSGAIYRWLLVIFSLGMVLSGLAISQWVAIRKEQENLERRIQDVSIAVENAATVAARLPEFRREVARKWATLEALRAILPEELEVAAYLEQVARYADARSVRIVSTHTVTNRYDFYEEAATRLVLEGDEDAVASLRGDVLAFDRVARWRDEADGTVTLTIYAMRAGHEAASELCGEVEEGATPAPWLPLHRDALAARREELSKLCQTYERLLPIHVQVEAYRSLLAEVEEVEALVARLR